MRVLVVSDLHGNVAALRAVRDAEKADAVLCLGDLVDYGPDPAACVRWVLRFGPTLVVNPGSVGQPRDGDPRAAYAVFVDGVAVLARAWYDVETTVRRLARRVAEALLPEEQ